MAEIIKEYPPNYDRIKEVFNPPETVCFCYGDKIYNPSGNKIVDHLLVHEGVHEQQQKIIGVEEWWNKYLDDVAFRLSQEAEAYATQLNWIKERTTEKISLLYLDMFAEHLSILYKTGIDKNKAFTLIRKTAKELTK